MISRAWHGYTTHDDAYRYQAIVTGEVIPEILAMGIPGFERNELFRRRRGEDVEFVTVMWFRDLDAVRHFIGGDYDRSHVPPRANEVLSRFDTRSRQYDVLLAESAR